jgi:hypothetical protein
MKKKGTELLAGRQAFGFFKRFQAYIICDGNSG